MQPRRIYVPLPTPPPPPPPSQQPLFKANTTPPHTRSAAGHLDGAKDNASRFSFSFFGGGAFFPRMAKELPSDKEPSQHVRGPRRRRQLSSNGGCCSDGAAAPRRTRRRMCWKHFRLQRVHASARPLRRRWGERDFGLNRTEKN